MKIINTLKLALAATAFAFSLAGCSQDIRDIKISQLTQAQKKDIGENLKPDELELVIDYEQAKRFNNYVDLSVNEIIKIGDGEIPIDKSKVSK